MTQHLHTHTVKYTDFVLLEAGILADVMSSLVTAQVVPEVIPEDWEEGVVDLHHAEAHLPAVAVVVGLTVGPVKPLHGGVAAVPDPLSGGVLAVTTLGENIKVCFKMHEVVSQLRGLRARKERTLQSQLSQAAWTSSSSSALQHDHDGPDMMTPGS